MGFLRKWLQLFLRGPCLRAPCTPQHLSLGSLKCLETLEQARMVEMYMSIIWAWATHALERAASPREATACLETGQAGHALLCRSARNQGHSAHL